MAVRPSGLGLLLFCLRLRVRSMELVHGALAALLEELWKDRHRIAHFSDDLVLFIGWRASQHVIEHFVLVPRVPDTEPKAPELVAEMRDEILESVVPARAAAEFQAHDADRQIEIVMRNEHLLEIDLAVIEQALEREPAAIHERERREDLEVVLANAKLRDFALEAALRAKLAVVLTRQCIGEPEAGVVTRERVLRPGIAESHDESQRKRSHG